MEELKLRRLYRGFILTDFDNNEIGIKDLKQALEEIRNILGDQPQDIAQDTVKDVKPASQDVVKETKSDVAQDTVKDVKPISQNGVQDTVKDVKPISQNGVQDTVKDAKPISQAGVQDTVKDAKPISQAGVQEEKSVKKRNRVDSFELQTRILDKAKEQISQNGRINAAKIARELEANHSTVNNYIKKKLDTKIAELIKEWQEEHGKQEENGIQKDKDKKEENGKQKDKDKKEENGKQKDKDKKEENGKQKDKDKKEENGTQKDKDKKESAPSVNIASTKIIPSVKLIDVENIVLNRKQHPMYKKN